MHRAITTNVNNLTDHTELLTGGLALTHINTLIIVSIHR